MADIFWTVSLYRLKWLGLGPLWEETEDAPRVRGYVASAFKRPSFVSSVLDWPLAYSPSPHVEEGDGIASIARFAWRMFRRGR